MATRHLASIAEIVEAADFEATVRFYEAELGFPVERVTNEYAVVEMPGTLHFGVWARPMAAEATFGDRAATDRVPLGFTLGFEVDSVEKDAKALEQAGRALLQAPKTEPWGQVTSRFLSPSGALCELSEMPPRRRITRPMEAGPEA